MRAIGNSQPDDRRAPFWFYLTTVGKHTYATIFLDSVRGRKVRRLQHRREFEKWRAE